MHLVKRAAVATVTAGSIMFLGVGVAQAGEKDVKVDKKVTISIKDVTQVCKSEAKKQKNVAHHNKNTAVGSNFICVQSVSVG